ncbi:hypothetical protein [Candidatus Coxiella mudrowiae]|uniref:hypothetical protein n=1 Tax=Candidatus Coxiella mudrowiae TaxID=2054173 RepID=UPI0009E62B31|nr:hypothetical protein [Candidatus Coxiella mudrowiae]
MILSYSDFKLLSDLRGVGKQFTANSKATAEIQRHYLQESLARKGNLFCTQDVQRFLSAQLRHHENEVFTYLFLYNRHRIHLVQKIILWLD